MLDETEISSTSENTKNTSQINLRESILDLYKQGLTYQDIADRHQISEAQVKNTLVYHPEFSQFLDLYKQGLNYHEIAAQYQLSKEQVRLVLVNNPAFHLYLKESVLDLYEQGLTYQDIADWHQITEQRVRKILYINYAFDKFFELYKQGYTYQDIAERCRTSEQKVRDILNNAAFNQSFKDLKDRVMQPLDCNSESYQFLDLYKQGHTYEDIAAQYQISKQQVRKILKSNPAFEQYRKDLTESVRQLLDSNSGLSHHLLDLYKQELTYKEIGDRHQISQRQVMYILDKSSAYQKYVRERDKKKVAEQAILGEEKAEQFKKNLYLKSLDVLYPERVRELWDYGKNGNLKPEEIYTVTNILIWLKCPLDGYSWTKQLDDITAIWEKGTSGCPECARKLAHSESPLSSSLPDELPSKLLDDSSNGSSSNGNEFLGSTPDSCSLVGSACDLPGKPPCASPLFSGLANELPSKLLDDSSNGSLSNLFKGTEVEETQTFKEGSSRQVRLNRYERNPQARKKCIEYYGTDCCICGFDFEKVFGEKGKGLIHVHHLIPLSEKNKEYKVNPREDLRPVCPNCHAMIHRKNPPYSIEELKSLLNGS